jgi:hypothetical protein
MLTSMHNPPAKGNFFDGHGSAVKPSIIVGCRRKNGFVGRADIMMNSYSISQRMWKLSFLFSSPEPYNSEQLCSFPVLW